jgi:hypothetical protein
MIFWEPKNRDYVLEFQKKKWEGADSRKQRRIAVARSFAIQMLFHICIEYFISYPWTPRTQFLEFIWFFESQKTETMS